MRSTKQISYAYICKRLTITIIWFVELVTHKKKDDHIKLEQRNTKEDKTWQEKRGEGEEDSPET